MKKKTADRLGWLISILVILVLLGGCSGYVWGTAEHIIIKVTDKERMTSGRGENADYWYRVDGVDETFENTDAPWYWKWNSSDIQRELEIGETYIVKVYGWRIPIFSLYRNIVRIVPRD